VGPHRRGSVPLTGAVRVVPDVASFAVDDGFAYAVPEGMAVEVGSLVRVPLGGRRVRGWVVAVGEPPRPRLRPLLAVSGNLAVFDAAASSPLPFAEAPASGIFSGFFQRKGNSFWILPSKYTFFKI